MRRARVASCDVDDRDQCERSADRPLTASTLARDTNFYYSFLVLPPDKRRAIVAVWDFCRAVDDAVDERGRGRSRRREVARWRGELARCFDGGNAADAAGPRAAAARQPVQPAAFGLRSADRRRRDGSRRRAATKRSTDLYEYCIRVASAVGLICLEIFGYAIPRSRQYATDLGVALQLTNILRDVPEDLRARPRLHPAGGSPRARVFARRTCEREIASRGHGVRSPNVTSAARGSRRSGRATTTRAPTAELPRADRRQPRRRRDHGRDLSRASSIGSKRADYDVFSRSCACRARGAR